MTSRPAMNLEGDLALHAPFLRALARGLVADSATADDLVQDTCLAALDSGAPPPRRLLPWLATVLRNHAGRRHRSDRRRRAREQAIAADACSPDAITVASRLEVARRLLQHVEALDPRGREVIYLRFYQDHKPRQIAAELGLPLATIKTRLARALARLRERLDGDDPQGRRAWLPALCVIGDIGPGASGAAGGARVLRRAFALRPASLALAVVVGTVGAVALHSALVEPVPPPPDATAVTAAADAAPDDAIGARQTIAAAPSSTIVQGLVEDAGTGAAPGTGTPAAGVVVRYRWLEQAPSAARGDAAGPTNRQRTVELETATDAHGQFHIELPERAELLLVEARGNEVLREATWWRASFLPQPLLLTRYLRGTFEGNVVEPAGGGVAQAIVHLLHREHGELIDVAATTDAGGRFVFAQGAADAWLQAERDGFVQVCATSPSRDDRGGWRPGRIVLARSATLTVEFVNAAGEPEPTADGVAIAVGAAERGLLADMRPDSPSKCWTPAVQGRSTRSVPAGLQLLLWACDMTFTGDRDGCAVALEPGTGGVQPIVLDADEARVLRIVLATNSEVQGTVVDPDGHPVAGADVDFQQVRGAALESIGMSASDEHGHFARRVAGTGERQPVVVSVRGCGPTAGLTATRLLEIGGTAPLPIEMRLAAPQALTGRVSDAAGAGVAAHVDWQVQIPGIDNWLSLPGGGETDEDGVFRLMPVLDAPHRLHVVSERHASVTVDGIRPGTAPIKVVVGPPKPSRIQLRAVAPKPLNYLMVAACYRSDGVDPAAEWPPLSAASAWSPAAVPAGCEPRPHAAWHIERHRLQVADDGSVELWLQDGPAWLSVSGQHIDGEETAVLTSGAVTIPRGQLALSVDLTPRARCRGQVEFDAHSEQFPACVAIADDAGRLLGICVPGDADVGKRMVPTSSHGHFAFAAPRGTWELRVGTRDELERGAARARRLVVLADDVTEPIVLRL